MKPSDEYPAERNQKPAGCNLDTGSSLLFDSGRRVPWPDELARPIGENRPETELSVNPRAGTLRA